jgi:drug/metabolite transporter (DMT)-like permease
MNNIIFSKLLSESLLSLYPIFIKKLKLNINLQIIIRLIIYLIISLFFCNINFILKHIFKYNTLILGFINLIHIYSSYKGFELLESGLSYTLFYTYPIFILLFSGTPLHISIFISLLGVFILTKNEFKNGISVKGLIMILIASITEALIYFYIRKINTKNNWNHLFLTYFYGTLIILIYYIFKKFNNKNKMISNDIENKKILLSLVINSIIGSLGYYLRFYATSRLNPFIYAILSYFGIFMSFIYGILFNNEKITLNKIIGSLLIFIGSKKELLSFIKNIF